MLSAIFVTIIFQDVQHHCMAHVDGGEFALRTITIGAPSKTFNIPGGCVDIYIYISFKKQPSIFSTLYYVYPPISDFGLLCWLALC